MNSDQPARGARRIPVAAPVLRGREREYVLDCLDTTWISSTGRYIDEFERAFAEFCGVRTRSPCCNGTAPLHLALVALGRRPGRRGDRPDPDLRRHANTVIYCGATPVFVDAEPATWNLDPAAVAAAVTPRTKGDHAGPSLRPPRRHGPDQRDRRRHGCRRRGRRRGARRRVPRPPRGRSRRHRHVLLLRQQDHHHGRGRDGHVRLRRGRRLVRRCAVRGRTRSGATGSRSSASTTG